MTQYKRKTVFSIITLELVLVVELQLLLLRIPSLNFF